MTLTQIWWLDFAWRLRSYALQCIRRCLYSVRFASGFFLPPSTLLVGADPVSLGLTERQPNKRERKLVDLFTVFKFLLYGVASPCLLFLFPRLGFPQSGYLYTGLWFPQIWWWLLVNNVFSVGSRILCWVHRSGSSALSQDWDCEVLTLELVMSLNWLLTPFKRDSCFSWCIQLFRMINNEISII